ncbi:purine and uridine phosphorylase [Aspergillus homomorphus CBS 101889]|uniref:Purine and uridine phosphorylase n=1 Tax=Aspergillus homomorphus (strain CBS 101889) TaxID=1450537 RepID=A0A395I4I8_ASPHC|nr:purine and uridine phosphorylase [Aspergillus homomorphus CBS 101889]RAL14098.1 purine and uridine phosphorylase [Aspergillus homomorphus CBS 101889]
MNSTPSFTHDDYTVACICPMSVEQASLEAMLDEIHPDLPTATDKNSYTLGRMHKHNVVVAVMPRIGNSSAASMANQLLNDFRRVRFSFLVGIGGGIPNLLRGVDIRLGDVVVSKPSGVFGGVVQFRQGKLLPEGQFERTGALHPPPDVLSAAVARLEALHRRAGSAIPRYLQEMTQRYPRMKRGGCVYQGVENDQLFRAEYKHAKKDCDNCEDCDQAAVVQRPFREDREPVVHYGTIGSSDVVVRDGQLRDSLRDGLNLYCVEMEAAGLMDSLPCLVIRGICDYADSHKNKRWQPYAAATAAAYAKELLSYIPILNRQQPSSAILHMQHVGNVVNGSVHGDFVAGDKVAGDKLVGDKVWQGWR